MPSSWRRHLAEQGRERGCGPRRLVCRRGARGPRRRGRAHSPSSGAPHHRRLLQAGPARHPRIGVSPGRLHVDRPRRAARTAAGRAQPRRARHRQFRIPAHAQAREPQQRRRRYGPRAEEARLSGARGLRSRQAGIRPKVREFAALSWARRRASSSTPGTDAGRGAELSRARRRQAGGRAALESEMVRLDVVQQIMEREANTNILFLDACRDNPLARNLARAMGPRSAEMDADLPRSKAARHADQLLDPAGQRRSRRGGPQLAVFRRVRAARRDLE